MPWNQGSWGRVSGNRFCTCRGIVKGRNISGETRYHGCMAWMTISRTILVGLAMWFGSGWCFAAERAYVHFQRAGSETGPPAEVITAVMQDRDGFVWIGSREGLSRYDGETFVAYRHDPGDPASISDHSIRTIFEDRSGNLWIGTNSAGLNRLDRATGRFEHFRHDSGDPTSLSHNSVYGIAQDKTGDLWVATQKGLNRFDPQTETFERFLADPNDPHSISDDYVTCILIDQADRLWLGTNRGGLNLLDRSTDRFTVFRNEEGNVHSLAGNSVFALLEDENGFLWVGGQGVHRLDPATGSFDRIAADPDDPFALSYALVVTLAAGAPGTIWVGTFGGGLNALDVASGRCRAYQHDPGERHSLGDDRVLSLATDSTGTLWIGTWGGGLWRLTRPALHLAAATADVFPPENIPTVDVTGMAAGSNDGLWIGTRFGDLLRKVPGRPGYSRYSSLTGIINDIEETDDGLVWVGKANGLIRLNPTTRTTTIFKHDPEVESSLGPGYVTALLEDAKGRLWVGTGEGGLQRLDSDGRVVERFVHVPGDTRSLSDDYVKSLVQDRDGTIWVGTRSGGLNAYDPITHQGRRFLPDPDDLSAISHHYVATLYEDSRGRLWIGTGGGGLNLLLEHHDGTVTFDRVSTADGLIDNNVMAILEDDDGSLWLSTKRGLSRFDPESKRFSHLFVGDGLPAAEFEPGAAARTAETLYFGSVRWLAAVPAGTPFPQHPPSPVVITSIRDINGELFGEEPQWRRKHLEIPFDSWLSLTLAVLDFNAEHHHAYQFRLGDEDEPWVDLGARREITFLDLDPGTHEFSARARNCQGVWNDITQTLTINVPPPFWMTMWFRAAVFLLVTTLILGFHRVRTIALRRRNLELLELHEQREKAQAKLAQAYDRLRRLTRRLEATKEEERQRIARELHDEMGPALTAVIINLQLMSGSKDEEKSDKWLVDSIEIVDRMVQQVRDLSLALRPPLLDEVGFLSAIRGYLETQAERTGLKIQIEGPPELDAFPPEIEITAFRVIQEAVSNVIRHAESTKVTVSIELEAQTLILSVEDDGIGFDTRAAMNASAPGSALGLVGMQERVQILGGEFSIESKLGEGTRVDVRIPVEVEA